MIDNEMKDKVKKEYYRRERKILETKLNNGNLKFNLKLNFQHH